MKTNGSWITTAGLAGFLCLATAAWAAEPAKPAAAPQGEALLSSTTVTATVTAIDHKTREVTLKANDGQEVSFVVGAAAKNLAQVNKGDVVTATYTEAVAYEVRKSGKAPRSGFDRRRHGGRARREAGRRRREEDDGDGGGRRDRPEGSVGDVQGTGRRNADGQGA